MDKRNNKWEFYEACKSGDLQLVKRIIDIDIINTTCSNGYTGFILACKKGHKEVVNFILKYTQNNHIYNKLFNFRRNILNKMDKYGHTGFVYACGYGHIDIVKMLLLDEHIDVNLCGFNSMNGFMAACYKYNLNVVKLLLTIDEIDFNKKYKGKTSFMILCENTYINNNKNKLIKLLLSFECINVNLIDFKGNTAFMSACINNDIDLIILLLSYDRIDINVVNNNGNNAYDIVKLREYDMLEKLLSDSGKLKNIKNYRCIFNIILDNIFDLIFN